MPMVYKSLTKFSVAPKKGPNDRIYYSPRIYLPTKLVNDSRFPFKDGEDLVLRIDGRKLVITKKPRTRDEINRLVQEREKTSQ